ncbi:MAG: DUF2914 domain-containing protein [Holophagales bacterium]|jgi:hypothetical protein|nr:DUF2914 domain-containing protein [Holophagales bacterium]
MITPSFLLGLATLLGAPAAAVEASPLKATEMAVCRDIVDRGCESEGRAFGPDVENVAFLTKVDGATGEAFVFHVWSFEGKEVKRARLSIRAAQYRTWSLKRVKDQPGRWRVEVLDPVGRSLGVVDFTVHPRKID